jgi:hypothetical protein
MMQLVICSRLTFEPRDEMLFSRGTVCGHLVLVLLLVLVLVLLHAQNRYPSLIAICYPHSLLLS